MLSPSGRLRSQTGQTVVEVLVAIGVASVMLPALATALVASREGQTVQSQRLEATAMLREADEAVRSERELGWTQIATNGTYHPVVSGNAWDLTSGSETVNGYTRQIVISDAQRNSSGAIVTSGGTVDPSTKRIVSTVSWTTPFASSVSSESYYHRYLGNLNITQTTQANFNLGTLTDTATTSTADGEVTLAPGISGYDWGSPAVVGSYNAAGTQDALDIYVVGDYAYLCDGTVMSIIDVSDPTSPSLVGTYSAPSTVNHVYVDGNYAYLSTISNTAEMVVVNITNKAAPVLAATEDLAGTADALSTFVLSGYAYVGRVSSTTTNSREFQIVNVTTPTNPTPTGGIDITANVTNIKVSGNFAYLATTHNNQELTIANVTNKASPTSAGVYNAAGTADATDLGLDGTTVYLSLAVNSSGAEVFSINVATPASPSLLDTYEVGGTVTGISPHNSYTFLSSAIANRQLIVLDSTAPNNLLLEANVNLDSNSNDVKGSNNYAFVASASNTQELTVVGPGVVSSGYQTNGTFVSSTIDTGAVVGFNHLTFTIAEPAGTNIQFQIATNTDNATWNYVGPDGTAGTFYTSPAAISLNRVTGRYLRYQATLTGPGTATPTINDVSVNYSP